MCDWNFLCCNLYLMPLTILLCAFESSDIMFAEIFKDSNKSDSLLSLLFFNLNKPIFFFLSWNPVLWHVYFSRALPLGLLLYMQRICSWAMDCTVVLSCGFAASEQRGKSHSSGPANYNLLDADPCLVGCFSNRGTLLTVVWLVHQDPMSLSAKLLSNTFMGFFSLGCMTLSWDHLLVFVLGYSIQMNLIYFLRLAGDDLFLCG